MYASIIVAGLIGYVLNMLFMLADKRLIHWNGK
jgi:NitT/TauT family transport system permease protein